MDGGHRLLVIADFATPDKQYNPKKGKMTTQEHIDQMHTILQKEGPQKAAIYAHELPEPSRMDCLKQLRLTCEMHYPYYVVQNIDAIIAGRMR